VACDIAKSGRVKDLKDGFTAAFSSHSKNLSDAEQKQLQDDLRAWVQWCDKWGEGASLLIVKFRERLRQAVRQTLKDLREYDEASLLRKLQRLL
jgi:nucleotidyltransferase/DNA polymerase involved in DNA repair